MGYGYRTYSNGVKTRFTRGAPREYTCVTCGEWMRGADNCFPGSCSSCVRANSEKEQAERLKKKNEG